MYIEEGIHQVSRVRTGSSENRIATTNYVDGILDDIGLPHIADHHGQGRSGRLFLCKLTANETGGGKYTTVVYTSKGELHDPTAGVASADIEGDTVFGNAVYVNLQEVGAGTHDLTDAGNTAQRYFIGHFNGYTSETTPRAVFVGNAVWLDTCPESLMALAAAESYAPVTADTTLTFEDTVVLVDATAGDVVITLPGAGDTNVPGTSFTVKKIDASANIVSVASADLIDGAATYDLELQYEFVEVTSGGAAFYVTGE